MGVIKLWSIIQFVGLCPGNIGHDRSNPPDEEIDKSFLVDYVVSWGGSISWEYLFVALWDILTLKQNVIIN